MIFDIKRVSRAGDNSETVRKRLATYAEQTRPLIDFYRSKSLLRSVDGSRDAESIYQDIEHIVTNGE